MPLPATVDKLVAEAGANAERSAGPEALAKACRVVITMLPDGTIVRDVLLGAQGLARSLAQGSVADRHEFLLARRHARAARGPGQARDSAGRCSRLGRREKAIDGSLAIMAGGEADVVERCRPLLEPMGKVFTTGGSGTGHALKAMNTFPLGGESGHRGGSGRSRSALRARPGPHDRHLQRVDPPEHGHRFEVPEQRAARGPSTPVSRSA